MNTRRCLVAFVATFALIALSAAPAGAAPTASFDVSANPTSGSPVTFTSTSTAPLLFEISKVEWDFDGNGTYDAEGVTATHTFASGTYQVGIRVTSTEPELTGNTATASKPVIVVTRPPVAAFSFGPSSPETDVLIQFASNSSDPDGDELTHNWDFGDGSGPVAERNPTHAYATPGQKTVRLTVNDGKGGADDVTQTIVVRDPRAPTAAFKSTPATPRAGDKVTFTSTSAPVEGQEIESQQWDL